MPWRWRRRPTARWRGLSSNAIQLPSWSDRPVRTRSTAWVKTRSAARSRSSAAVACRTVSSVSPRASALAGAQMETGRRGGVGDLEAVGQHLSEESVVPVLLSLGIDRGQEDGAEALQVPQGRGAALGLKQFVERVTSEHVEDGRPFQEHDDIVRQRRDHLLLEVVEEEVLPPGGNARRNGAVITHGMGEEKQTSRPPLSSSHDCLCLVVRCRRHSIERRRLVASSSSITRSPAVIEPTMPSRRRRVRGTSASDRPISTTWLPDG